MKTNYLLAIATVITFSSLTLNAAEPLLSPRAAEHQTRTVAGTTPDRIDRAFNGSPKAATLQTRVATGPTQDRLAHSVKLISPRALDHVPALARANGK